MKKLKKLISALLVVAIAVTSLVVGAVTSSAADGDYYCYYDETGKELQFDGSTVGSPVLVISGVTAVEDGNYYANVIYSDYYVYIVKATILSGDDQLTFEFSYPEMTKSRHMNIYDANGNNKNGLLRSYFFRTFTDGKGREPVFVLNDSTPENKRLIKLISEAETCKVTVGLIDTSGKNPGYFYNYYKLKEDKEGPVKNFTGRPYPYEEPAPAEEETAEDTTTQNETQTQTAALKDISSFSFGKIADQTYTGKKLTPAVSVTDNGKALTKDTDYTVTYADNKDIGRATATITGKGSYAGSKTLSFNIVPKSTTLTAKKSGSKIKLSWKAVSGITKYQVQYSTDGGKTFKSGGKFAASKKNASLKLDTSKSYVFRIRTYKTVNGKNYYSAWSKNVKVK